MRDPGQPDQDRVLRSMEIHSVDEDVDVTPAIMQKVRQTHQLRHGRHQGKRRRSILIATLSAIFVLSSITVYASTYLVQIKNKEGQIILSTMDPWKFSVSEYNQKRREETEAELKKKLKPGEQAVYYIKDKQMTADAKEHPLNYCYLPIQHKDYDDLAKDIEEKGAPEIQNPAYVPEGYTFDHGRIQITNEPVWNTPEYESLLNELKEKAEKSEEERKLFYKIVPWSQVASTVIQYRKGESQLTMIAFARSKGSTVKVPSKQAVKLTVKGTEMILSSSTGQSRRLTWLSETEEILYVITDDPKDPLSNDEFAKIAAGMIRE